MFLEISQNSQNWQEIPAEESFLHKVANGSSTSYKCSENMFIKKLSKIIKKLTQWSIFVLSNNWVKLKFHSF